jgi:hypothetical protein
MSNDSKQPLIPSLLYTEGSEKVQKEVENDLKVPDPDAKVVQAAIEKATVKDEDKKPQQ